MRGFHAPEIPGSRGRWPCRSRRPPRSRPRRTTPVIVVTGQGLEQTPATPAYDVIELDREKIVSGSSGRIEDVLDNVAGFQQFRRSDSRSSNPSAQGATLRALGGNATSRALVLLDAVPMLDPFFGYVPFSAIAPERLESIRVTRGGGSGPFGSGALAGAIELDSADAATLGLFSGPASINDRAETELSGTVAPELGDGFAVRQRPLGPRQGLLDHARGAARAGERAREVRRLVGQRAAGAAGGRRPRGAAARDGVRRRARAALRRAPTPAARGRTSAPGWSAAGRGRSTRSPMASGATSPTW